MRILGIDPGTLATGYGLIEQKGNSHFLIDCGCIRTSTKFSLSKRLLKIYSELLKLIQASQASSVCVEEAFYAKNVRTTLILGHARGVILLAAETAGLDIFEYSPREIKKSVTGNGAASKEQVQFMVQRLLNIREIVEPTDASDALAVALCHAGRWRPSR